MADRPVRRPQKSDSLEVNAVRDSEAVAFREAWERDEEAPVN